MNLSDKSDKVFEETPKVDDLSPEYTINPFHQYIEKVKHDLSPKDTAKADFVVEFLRPTLVDRGRVKSIPVTESVYSFMQFGHGLFSYFYAMKYFALLFAILTVISLVPMGYNISGHGLDDFPNVPFWMKTTLINSPILLQIANTTIKVQNVSQPNISLDEYKPVSQRIMEPLPPTPPAYNVNNTINTTLPTNSTNETNSLKLPVFSQFAYSLSPEYVQMVASNSFDPNINPQIPANLTTRSGAAYQRPVVGEVYSCESASNCTNSITQAIQMTDSSIENSRVTNTTLSSSKSSGSYLDLSILQNSFAQYANLTNVLAKSSNIVNTTFIGGSVENSQISISKIMYAGIKNSKLLNWSLFMSGDSESSVATNSTAYKSNLDYSNITGCDIDQNNITYVNATASQISKSEALRSNMTMSGIFISSVAYSGLKNYYLYSSTVSDSIFENINEQNFDRNFHGYVKNSTIRYSKLQNSNVDNSNVTRCQLINSDVYNSTLVDKFIINAVVIDGVIQNRTVSRLLQSSNISIAVNQSNNTKNVSNNYTTYVEMFTDYFNELDLSESDKYFRINLICDCIFCLVYIIGIYLFKVLFVRMLSQVTAKTSSVAKFAIELRDLPDEITKADVVELVKRFTSETIVSIQFAYDFKGALNLLLDKKKAEVRLGELLMIPDSTQKAKNKIAKLQTEHETIVNELTELTGNPQNVMNDFHKPFKVMSAYVIFNRSSAPKEFLMNFGKASQANIGSADSNKQFILKNRIKPGVPSDGRTINFEHFSSNINIKIIKIAVFIVVMLGIIALTTYLCNLIESKIEESASSVKCKEDQEYSKFDPNNRGDMVHQCYCQKNVNYMLSYQYRIDCREFIFSDASKYYAPIVVVIILTVVNIFIEFCVDHVFDWTGFSCESTQMTLKVLVLFLLEYVNMVSILFTTATIEVATEGNSEAKTIKKKLELISPDFYFGTGSKMIMLSFFGMFLPHLILLARSWLMRLIRDKRAQKAKLQKDYIHNKKPATFELDGHYVYFLTSIASALTFSSAMPILILFCLASFVIAFWVNKFVFVKYCKRPLFYDEKLVIYIILVLPWILLFRVFFSVSVYGDPSIFLSKNRTDYVIQVLTTETIASASDDINARIVKSIALVIIVAILIVVTLFETIGMFTFGIQYLNRWKAQHDTTQTYLKEYPTLLYNSTLNYDFRMQPKFYCLLSDTSSSALTSLAVLKNAEAELLRSQFADVELKNNFESYMENFLLYCKEGYVVGTEPNIVISS